MQSQTEFIDRTRLMRRALVWAAQIGLFALSAGAAFLVRFDFSLPSSYLGSLGFALVMWVAVKVVVFRLAKLDRGLWRYVSAMDLVRLAVANLAASAAACAVILAFGPAGFPRSLYLLDLMICFLLTSGLRLGVRIGLEATSDRWRNRETEKRTLIYGAGGGGTALLHEIRNNARLAYRVVGFVDDLAERKGMRVAGVPVLGGGDAMRTLVARQQIEMVLIAIPSATGTEMTRILELCHTAGVDCRTVPGLGEMIEGHGLTGQIREVAVEDLLGRTPVRLEEGRIRSSIEGKMVMVTGAAGSIGSELCRQIAHFHPSGIVGFEIAESPLFEIDREMKLSFPHVPFYPEIGSIQNRARVDEVLRRYRPAAIYHAAAYKHVPLMETHVFEAVENNVFGTYNVAAAAAENGVEDFVMISSDKAVRPTNVMGTTKRIAEMILRALQNGRTKYVAVRFGNVLGSNGSVIPIFKKQIAAGGPVTVTHPEMRRFFMTIPEACQLVLQAAAIGNGGQICVLDMGQPVKIVDLARNLILLSGLRPDKDVKIEFTGMRPGEKLYEELSSLLEDTVPTEHEKIRIFVGDAIEEEDIQGWLDTLREISDTRDMGRLIVALKEIVLDYNPSTHLLRRVLKPRGRHEAPVPVDVSRLVIQAKSAAQPKAPSSLSA
jgi:FlaA1/EpsC-like NDP-sugar epimerase